MSEVIDTTEPSATSTSSAMDRRSALKKAAVGGAIAWTAPTLLSSRVSAAEAGFCTPKCVPSPVVNLRADSLLYCPEPDRKWVQIDFTIGADMCPCGPEGSSIQLVQATITSGNATFKEAQLNGSTGFLRYGGPGNSELEDDTYGSRIRFQTTCIDRDGSTIVRFCNFSFAFTFTPDDSECSAPGNVGTVVPGSLICDEPICNPS